MVINQGITSYPVMTEINNQMVNHLSYKLRAQVTAPLSSRDRAYEANK